ncbi:MAG: hypothetical protein IH951_11785 [Bacteroidetes bacterium]|nr:hypothetical protein [Bacteroidota bacterium]
MRRVRFRSWVRFVPVDVRLILGVLPATAYLLDSGLRSPLFTGRLLPGG